MIPVLPPIGNTAHHRLLGGWRDVLDDIRALCRDLQKLSEVCQCGHGPGHLRGICPCCGTTATTTSRLPACEDCEAQLSALRPAIDLLMVDTSRFFPVVKEILARDDPLEGQRAREIERRIAVLVRSFKEVVFAEGRFRNDCRASHLKTLGELAATLRRDAESLDSLV